MELSSFQLHWNTKLVPDVSILTNLAPDHINWHGSYENYIADKCRIFNMCGRTDCYAVTQSGDACRVPHGRRVCTLGGESGMAIVRTGDDIILKNSGTERKLFSVNKLKLVGRHNLENASMAAAAVVLAFPDAEPELGMESFVAPRHRCEYAGTVHGVTYINDSKGTNVASVVTALRSIGGRKIIILGGQGKGEKYDLLAETVRENTKASIVLGSEREAITEALKKAGCKNISSACDMADAVKKASEMAENGDIVLLSPACTSWDMYSSYEQRGDHFVSLVRGLEKQ